MQEQGYRIIPVHPDYDEVLGERVYPAVYDIPEDISLDIVDIFRDSRHTLQMVEDICRRVEQTGERPVVWTQLGVSSREARGRAGEEDLTYVENRCLMVEHRRMLA